MKTRYALALGALASTTFCVTSNADIVPDNGSGRWQFPPLASTYTIPSGFPQFHIVDGLPPGTTIEIDFELSGFFNVTDGPGGGLGGTAQTWNAVALMQMQGTGTLSGFSKTAAITNMAGQTHLAPHMAFMPVSGFASDLAALQGQLAPGDSDFDLLRITAGSLFGMPSPGQIDAAPIGPVWDVGSFFDITYRIDFVGSPGGPLAGRSGSTTHVSRISFVPAPASAGLLGAAGLLTMRRRRERD